MHPDAFMVWLAQIVFAGKLGLAKLPGEVFPGNGNFKTRFIGAGRTAFLSFSWSFHVILKLMVSPISGRFFRNRQIDRVRRNGFPVQLRKTV